MPNQACGQSAMNDFDYFGRSAIDDLTTLFRCPRPRLEARAAFQRGHPARLILSISYDKMTNFPSKQAGSPAKIAMMYLLT